MTSHIRYIISTILESAYISDSIKDAEILQGNSHQRFQWARDAGVVFRGEEFESFCVEGTKKSEPEQTREDGLTSR